MVVRVPLLQEVNNCYDDDADLPKRMTSNLIGVIAGNDFTISQLIDLDYKDDQQEGMPIIYFEDKEELEKACTLLGVSIWTHSLCSYCKKVIRGSCGYGEKGFKCYNCDEEK